MRRRAATVDPDVGDVAGELLDRRRDRALQRMGLIEVVASRPTVDDARGEHPRVLAGAVHLDRLAFAARPQHIGCGHRLEREVGRVAERRLVEAGAGEDPPDTCDV